MTLYKLRQETLKSLGKPPKYPVRKIREWTKAVRIDLINRNYGEICEVTYRIIPIPSLKNCLRKRKGKK